MPAKRRPGLIVPALSLILFVLAGLPMLFVVVAAFTTEPPRPGSLGDTEFTLDKFALYAGSDTLRAAAHSLAVGVGATVLALVIGVGIAFLVARTDVPLRPLVRFAGFAPLFLPSLVGALAWSLLAGSRSGLLNLGFAALGLDLTVDVYGLGGLIMVSGFYYAPYAFLLSYGAMTLMNPEYEDAAAVHGAGRIRILRRVTLPLLLPAVLGAATLIFALAIENFPVAQVIGTPERVDTLPTLIFRLMSASPARANEAGAVALGLTLLAAVATYAQRRIVAGRDFTTVTGKGLRAKTLRLGGWRWPAFALVAAYLVLSIVAPLVALVVTALRTSPYVSELMQLFEPGALSVQALTGLIGSEGTLLAVRNSVVVATLMAALGTALNLVLAYVVYRTRQRGRAVLEYQAMAPVAVPSIVLGLGLLWTWLLLPVPVYGTIFVLVIAFLVVFLPQGYRGVSASILSIDKGLEESAMVHGAPRLAAVRRVTAPLMRGGLLSTFLLLLMLGMRELTVALFLFTSKTQLLSMQIFDFYDNGSVREAAAAGVVYCAIICVLALLSRRMGARGSDLA